MHGSAGHWPGITLPLLLLPGAHTDRSPPAPAALGRSWLLQVRARSAWSHHLPGAPGLALTSPRGAVMCVCVERGLSAPPQVSHHRRLGFELLTAPGAPLPVSRDVPGDSLSAHRPICVARSLPPPWTCGHRRACQSRYFPGLSAALPFSSSVSLRSESLSRLRPPLAPPPVLGRRACRDMKSSPLGLSQGGALHDGMCSSYSPARRTAHAAGHFPSGALGCLRVCWEM